MSELTKKRLFNVSNAIKHYAINSLTSLVDENGEWNGKGMKVVGGLSLVLVFVVFYLEGGS